MMTRFAAPWARHDTGAGRRLVGTSLLVLLFVLTACGGDGAGDNADATVSERGDPQAGLQTDAPSGDSNDRMELKISGGRFAGAHDVTGDMACFAQPGIWGAGLSRLGDPGISEYLVLLQGVPVTGGTSDQVEFAVTFGDVMADETGENSGLVGIGAASGGGSGTATVTTAGRGATIEVAGTSNHGTPLTAVIRCATVEVVR
jgi:hypothetical protein